MGGFWRKLSDTGEIHEKEQAPYSSPGREAASRALRLPSARRASGANPPRGVPPGPSKPPPAHALRERRRVVTLPTNARLTLASVLLRCTLHASTWSRDLITARSQQFHLRSPVNTLEFQRRPTLRPAARCASTACDTSDPLAAVPANSFTRRQTGFTRRQTGRRRMHNPRRATQKSAHHSPASPQAGQIKKAHVLNPNPPSIR